MISVMLVEQEAQSEFRKAVELHQRGRLSDAEEIYRAVSRAIPKHSGALHLLGVIAYQKGRFAEADRLIGQAIEINRHNATMHSNRDSVFIKLGPLGSFDTALELKPDFADALNNRGTVLNELGRNAEAIATYDKALAIRPDYAEALNNRGKAFCDLRRYDEALANSDKALEIRPNYAEALHNRGNALNGLKHFEEAIASFDQALTVNPDYAEAHNARGNALGALRRHAEALASYDRALAVRPDYSEALNNRGVVLNDLGRLGEALACYNQALTGSDFADVLNNRAGTYNSMKRYQEAASDWAKCPTLDPNYNYALGSRLLAKMYICDWSNFDADRALVLVRINSGTPAATPFGFAAISSSAAEQMKCAQLYTTSRFPESDKPLCRGERRSHERIRVGYISGDFRNHPSSHLIAGMFEHHDRSCFETIALSFGPDDHSKVRHRIQNAFETFIDVQSYGNRQIAELIHRLEIDIAVDLMGHQGKARTAVFADRPAPIQVNYLAFPGTMGARYFDYLVGDRIIIPPIHHQWYSEKIIYLPESYFVPYAAEDIADLVPTRSDLKLPERGFVFCCFNNTFKITPEIFDVWMRLLRAIEGSVLWLIEGDETSRGNLRREAESRGVSGNRLVFAPRVPLPDHFARHRQADLFLDTRYYGAHTTALDALWAGLPIVTCLGSAFPGRVAASLLTAIGFPELITNSLEEYGTLALKLARDPAYLASIKAKLANNRDVYPLFDVARFTRHMEAAYKAMWECYQRGEPPASFSVAPIS